jgi:RNA polymerase sigma-70 factor (ECF subfamily)
MKKTGVASRVAMATLNGLPAIVFEVPAAAKYAPRVVLQCEIDEAGLIREVYTVLASKKLTAV